MASQKRLGTIEVADGFFCQLAEAVHSANPRKGGEIFDKRLIHPCASCNKGPAKNRQHDFLKVSLSDSLGDANARVDYERVIPELCIGDTSNGCGSDAIMDVVATFPNATRQYWIDVTIRSPHANRYNTSAGTNASNTIVLAASEGCKEKWDRYKSQFVVPISFEPYGRLAIRGNCCKWSLRFHA
jgi:hypothetical protein